MNRRWFLELLSGAAAAGATVLPTQATRDAGWGTSSWQDAMRSLGILDVMIYCLVNQDAYDMHLRCDDGYQSAFILAKQDIEDCRNEYELAALLRRMHNERVPSA